MAILLPQYTNYILPHASGYIPTLGIDSGIAGPGWQCVHPSVLDFAAIKDSNGDILGTFGGYRYWAAWTTDEDPDDEGPPENPYLQRTNGTNGTSGWTTPIQLDTYGEAVGSGGKRSDDPCLIYDKVNNQVIIFWSRGDSEDATEKRVMSRTISSSLALGAPIESIANSTYANLIGGAPALCYDDDDNLHMWGISSVSASKTKMYYAHSENNGLSFSVPVQVEDENWFPSNYPYKQMWHIEARRDEYYPDKVNICVAAAPAIDNTGNGYVLAYINTYLSTPTILEDQLNGVLLLRGGEVYGDTSTLVNPSASDSLAWDGGGMYKPSFIPYRAGNELGLRLWYDGYVKNQYVWDQVGYTAGLIGLYLTSQANIAAGIATIEAWDGAAIYYGFDEAPTTAYSGPISVPSGAKELRWYAEDAEFTETVQLFSLANSIFNSSGGSGGTVLTPSGGSGGTIMRKSGSNWTDN